MESLNKATKQQNWHAALFIALTLPDICGNLDSPNESVGKRYREWFNSYLKVTLKLLVLKKKKLRF